MTMTVENPTQANKDKKTFWQWLMEDDSPEIGIASKESLRDYIEGVKYEFKKIFWPSKDQLVNEFFAVIIIVSIITAAVFAMDLGIAKLLESFTKG